MPDVYKKIESRIMRMKEKEDLWKGRYSELAKKVRELADSNSRKMNQMENSLTGFDARLKTLENQAKKNAERVDDFLRLSDRKISEFSQSIKEFSRKAGERDEQMKRLRGDVISQVNAMIGKHEKTFDSVLGKIDLAARKMETELQMQESIYQKMEGAKKFMEGCNAGPPKPAPQEPAFQKPLPPPPPAQAPVPARFQAETPFIYDPGSSPAGSQQNFIRRASRRPIEIDLDDDLDVDDVISGKVGGLKESVDSMSSNVSGITGKLAAIEDRMAEIRASRSPQLEKLDDKIRMYSESIADMHSRMETVEKALKDGMTPMMETIKMLTETVKGLKEESGSRPASSSSLAKPTPPDSWNSGEAKAGPAPVPVKRIRKPKPKAAEKPEW